MGHSLSELGIGFLGSKFRVVKQARLEVGIVCRRRLTDLQLVSCLPECYVSRLFCIVLLLTNDCVSRNVLGTNVVSLPWWKLRARIQVDK